jgi:beta-N-acetylhexosaminidase
VESPAQVQRLCAELHALASRPLVFVDQEGGRVRRLKPERGFAELPAAADFARLPEATRRALARRSCAEMRRLGIDFDLAPVVDLDSRPDNPGIGALGRAFSADPDEVRRNAAIWFEAARSVGLGLCLKHFPGLGGACTDSHLELTDLSGSFGAEQLELFFGLARETPGGAVLLSHGLVRDWDPEWPVSVSEPAVGLLRERVPDALLLTDDLQMQALQRLCGTVDACERAVRAGIDLLCICNNLLAQEAECFEAARRLERGAARDPALARRIADAQVHVRARKSGPST